VSIRNNRDPSSAWQTLRTVYGNRLANTRAALLAEITRTVNTIDYNADTVDKVVSNLSEDYAPLVRGPHSQLLRKSSKEDL
jgi:hypothetical protein